MSFFFIQTFEVSNSRINHRQKAKEKQENIVVV